MAQFVHLAPEKSAVAISRDGIKARRLGGTAPKGFERVVFAMPVTNDFYISHQWLRELKRSGQRTIVGIYFRIDDNEPVMVGHYNRAHAEMSADEAVGLVFNADSREGYEVMTPRKVEADEIFRVSALPQVLGWRFYPEAHGKPPCGCPVCLRRGEIKSKQLREAYEQSFAE